MHTCNQILVCMHVLACSHVGVLTLLIPPRFRSRDLNSEESGRQECSGGVGETVQPRLHPTCAGGSSALLTDLDVVSDLLTESLNADDNYICPT